MILSIENHCSVVQQKKMAQYLTDILGDKLDLSSVSSEDATMLPSPQMLKGKVLVKVSPSLALGPPTWPTGWQTGAVSIGPDLVSVCPWWPLDLGTSTRTPRPYTPVTPQQAGGGLA